MQKPTQNILSRDQFIKLRKAKTMIKDEFGKDVSLQDEDILNQIYGFALESSGESLFDLFTEISSDQPSPDKNNSAQVTSPPVQQANGHQGRIMVGDVVDGRVVTGMYRGKPTFKD